MKSPEKRERECSARGAEIHFCAELFVGYKRRNNVAERHSSYYIKEGDSSYNVTGNGPPFPRHHPHLNHLIRPHSHLLDTRHETDWKTRVSETREKNVINCYLPPQTQRARKQKTRSLPQEKRAANACLTSGDIECFGAQKRS